MLRRNILFAQIRSVCCVLLVCVLFLRIFYVEQKNTAFASTLQSLEKELRDKKASVKQFKVHLEELTEQERLASRDLRESEKSIKALEKDIATSKAALQVLDRKQQQIASQLAYLEREQKRQEDSLKKLLEVLWTFQVKKFALLEDGEVLHKEERQYVWVQVLLQKIEEGYLKIEESKKEIARTLEIQRNTYIEKKNQTQALEKQLKSLLSVALGYNKKLRSIRASKQTAEEELHSVLKLIVTIENQIEANKNVGKILPSSKGRLPFPVAGKVTKRYNMAEVPPYKGVGFTTKKNAVVTSIAEGTVVHNDILRGFGRVVIVSHGKNFYSLYAFLSSSKVELNSVVKQGEKIGETGYYPLLDTYGLYFELRKETSNLNPLIWLKKQ